MERIFIEGGSPLQGELCVQGAKNSVLPILAGTILTKGKSVIHNCPKLRDVSSAVKILEHIGCKVELDGSSLIIDPSLVDKSEIPLELMKEMRSSVIFLGAVLSRCKSASMSLPGGCELGPRPIDLHISALKKLGATINDLGGAMECCITDFEGCNIHLAFPSVGATENIMIAAAKSKGVTVVTNCAKEPEIEDLQNFLNKMGARIKGAGTSTIVIEGVDELNGVEYEVLHDRIVAVTYLTAAAITGGEILLNRAQANHISSPLDVLRESGCNIKEYDNSIYLKGGSSIKPVRMVQTMPYPGFPTDAQSILMAYLAVANGTSVFVENIFENRFKQVSEFNQMGADIKVMSKMAIVYGVKELYGSKVDCSDLRGGAALVVAALKAKGITEIGNLSHIDRGYENIEGNLKKLGAKIKRI